MVMGITRSQGAIESSPGRECRLTSSSHHIEFPTDKLNSLGLSPFLREKVLQRLKLEEQALE